MCSIRAYASMPGSGPAISRPTVSRIKCESYFAARSAARSTARSDGVEKSTGNLAALMIDLD